MGIHSFGRSPAQPEMAGTLPPVTECAACDSEPVFSPGRMPITFRRHRSICNRRIRVCLLSSPLEIQFSRLNLVHSFRIFDEEHEQALDASDGRDALNKLFGGSLFDQMTEKGGRVISIMLDPKE